MRPLLGQVSRCFRTCLIGGIGLILPAYHMPLVHFTLAGMKPVKPLMRMRRRADRNHLLRPALS